MAGNVIKSKRRKYDKAFWSEVDKLLDEGVSVQSIATILKYDYIYLKRKMKEAGYSSYRGFFKPGEMTKTIKREGVKSFSLGITIAYLKEDKTND
jgi:hypothetical protein